MENLIFIPIEQEDKFDNAFSEQATSIFSKGDKIAVKLHMGELGNPYHLKPDFVKRVIDILKALGAEPFIFDSPTKYEGQRHTVEQYYKTAEKHGFTEETIGCPIIISDESIQVKMPNITVNVCKPVHDADALLVLTHVKGHVCSGFGASIKNLGMGAVNKDTKSEIHGRPRPSFCGECIGCGNCVKVCPGEAISLVDKKATFNLDACWGCSACVNVCPVKVLEIKGPSFDLLLAEAGIAVTKNKEKTYYVNVIKDVAKLCDCRSDPGPKVIDDIGIVMGRNIVAVDKAAMDLINKKAGKDLFREINHISPKGHIEEAAKASGLSEDYNVN